jgi:hypothetical protein
MVFDTAPQAVDNRPMRRTRDESGIIVSWLVKIVLLLAVIGVVGFDLGSIVVNNVTLDSSAETVAVSVSLIVDEAPAGVLPDTRIYELAVEAVESETEGVTGARVLRKGTEIDDEGIVHIRLRRSADTLLAGRIGPLERYTVATANGQAGTN